MNKFYTLAVASLFVFAASHDANAFTVIDYGPNGNGANCYCFSLQDGFTAQSGATPSFLAISNCPGVNGWNSYTQPETMGAIGNFPVGNVVFSLPPPPANTHRVLVCGNPAGTTPLVDYGSGTVYASYADVTCPNGVSNQQVPAGQQPPWMSQFQGGNGGYPVCNP